MRLWKRERNSNNKYPYFFFTDGLMILKFIKPFFDSLNQFSPVLIVRNAFFACEKRQTTNFFLKRLVKIKLNVYFCSAFPNEKLKSPDGGIGRRAGLKHQWSNSSRFDPGSGY